MYYAVVFHTHHSQILHTSPVTTTNYSVRPHYSLLICVVLSTYIYDNVKYKVLLLSHYHHVGIEVCMYTIKDVLYVYVCICMSRSLGPLLLFIP